MRTLIRLRQEGVRPRSVFVDLVAKATRFEAEEFALSHFGIVNVTIESADSLADIDLRPLHGLMVFVSDYADHRTRHRRLAKLVAQVEPAHLIFSIFDDYGFTVHQRFQDRTETFRV